MVGLLSYIHGVGIYLEVICMYVCVLGSSHVCRLKFSMNAISNKSLTFYLL